MNILQFLQLNAQWICAIGMLVFAGVQVWLMFVQSRQQIRLQRIELANEMCKIFCHYPYDKDRCTSMMDWLMPNRAKFMFLLKKKDVKKYWKLADFIHDLQQQKPYSIGTTETDTLFFGYTSALVRVLGNTKNNISSYKNKNGKKIEQQIKSAEIQHNEARNANK